MESSVLSIPLHERAMERAQVVSLPWQLVAVMFASTSVILGIIWDISWHMTIGRDTFWTPAHMAIYTGGAVAGLASGFDVLRRSFFAHGASKSAHADGVTIWRVFRGSLGGWLCIWGAAAMLTSAPFDDWWHNAYGLDVKIISPPHTILALGFWGICIGALVMSLAHQHRSDTLGDNSVSRWAVAYMHGLLVTMIAIFTYEYQNRVYMHHSVLYVVSALVMPFLLVGATRSTRRAYPATTAAAVYSLVMCLQLWILPLFAASPRLGPIRQQVTHMVPMDFPLLLIVPALVIDLVYRSTTKRGEWTRALVLGVAYVVVLLVVQWPFGSFLMHGPSQNAFFRADNFAYMIPPNWPGPQRIFAVQPTSGAIKGFVFAFVIAVFSARAGLAWGKWLTSVRR